MSLGTTLGGSALFNFISLVILMLGLLDIHYSSFPGLNHSNHVASNLIYKLMLSKLKTSASHSRLTYSNVYLTSPRVLGRHLKFIQSNP